MNAGGRRGVGNGSVRDADGCRGKLGSATNAVGRRLRIGDVPIGRRTVPSRRVTTPAQTGQTWASSLEATLSLVARGDSAAFSDFYRRVAPLVLGVARRVVRDPAQSEEVAQEVLTEAWRTASRFDPEKGSALAWVTTIAHRRAVDRVRSEQKATGREARAPMSAPPYDAVVESVETSLTTERVRRCLGSLTDLQRESVLLAYYGGYTYSEVAQLLDVPLGTIGTRMRDGLIRLRDCLGTER